MKIRFKLLFPLWIIALIMGCSQEKNVDKKSNTVTISIQQDSKKAPEYKIHRVDMLTFEPTNLAESEPDSSGKNTLSFNLPSPTIAFLTMGEFNHPLYLSPGYNIEITVDSLPSKITSILGSGLAANNYLLEVAAIRKNYDNSGGKSFFDLEPDAFLARLDSLEFSLQKLHQQHRTSPDTVPEDIAAFLKKRNEIFLLQLKQDYAFMRYMGAGKEVEIPEKLQNLAEQIPLDKNLLCRGMYEYALLLHMYLETSIYGLIWDNIQHHQIDSIKALVPVQSINNINKGSYPPAFREFFLAKNIDRLMREIGMSPVLDSVYTVFKKEFSQSSYLPPLKENYAKWMTIASGIIAPDIIGTTPEDQSLSLSNLKGSVYRCVGNLVWPLPQ
jgi:hypothetical protein